MLSGEIVKTSARLRRRRSKIFGLKGLPEIGLKWRIHALNRAPRVGRLDGLRGCKAAIAISEPKKGNKSRVPLDKKIQSD